MLSEIQGRVALIAGVLLLAQASAATGATIVELERMVGEWTRFATALSDDGSAVLSRGRISDMPLSWSLREVPGDEYFIPTNPADGYQDFISGVSGDGQFVAGSRRHGPSGHYVATRWSTSGVFLPLYDGPSTSWSSAISSDGGVIAGTIDLEIGPGSEAFRWTSEGGLQRIGGLIPIFGSTEVVDTSADGSVLVGSGTPCAGCRYEIPWIWDADGGVRALPVPDIYPGSGYEPRGRPNAVSADGSTIVGRWDAEAYVWNDGQEAELIDFDGLGEALDPRSGESYAVDVSGDGSLVVGVYNAFADNQGAFIWDEANGARTLEVFFGTLGLDEKAFDIYDVHGISDDGTRILFGARSTPTVRGGTFLLIVPEPSTALLIALGLAATSRFTRGGAAARTSSPRNG